MGKLRPHPPATSGLQQVGMMLHIASGDTIGL